MDAPPRTSPRRFLEGRTPGASRITAGEPLASHRGIAPLKGAADKPAQPAVDLSVTLKECSATRCRLGLSLRYTGDKEIRVSDWTLPWQNTYSILLVDREGIHRSSIKGIISGNCMRET
jgi:hypothetical protein